MARAPAGLRQIGLHHPVATLVRDVQANKAGIPRRAFVAEGLYEANMVLATGAPVDAFVWCPDAAYSDESGTRAAQLAQQAQRSFQVSAKVMARLAERPNHDGLLCVARLPDWQPADIPLGPTALVLVADGIEIPGNLGTLVRTLDACGADCLALTAKRTRLTHPKALRASQGMTMKVPSVEFAEPAGAIDWLEREGFTTYLADTDQAIGYKQADYRGRTALVVGSERYGISAPWRERGYQRIAVPMLGAADSLNVSVSAAVLLFEARARKDGW